MNRFELNAPFLAALENAAKKIHACCDSDEIIRVSSHIDADGLSAAGIVCSALARLNAKFHLRILRQLYPEFIKELAAERRNCYIFSDLGSGQLKYLIKYFPEAFLLILDHHEPLKVKDIPPNIIEINPHHFNIDGSNELSGAGTSFLFAYSLDPSNNLDLLPFALIGAVGDTQDKGKQHSLIGLNAKIAEVGVNENLITIEKDLYFQYRENQPIHHALMATIDPFLPGLTGNEDACVRFLQSINVPLHVGEKWRTISDLTTAEKKNLTTQLTQQILSHGGTPEQASSLVSTNYLLTGESAPYLRDLREFAELLNACGRTRNPGIGVAICMGDRDTHYRRAQDLLLDYQKKINSFLEHLKHPGAIKETDYVQYFYTGDELNETMIGTISTIAIKTKLAKKILIGFAKSGDQVYKISARAPQHLITRGVHLGIALRNVIEQLKLDPSKFAAGGHDAAAGTQIPASKDIEFIETLNLVLKTQMNQKELP
ncbi:MAG: DHHA1 domain-containing protein [Candidatus Helarchaeota archaeon]